MTVQASLKKKLEARFRPLILEVVNESPNHNVPEGSESHFRVVIVSDEFEGVSTIERHQMVYAVLAEELKNQIHAFSQHTLTSKEWVQKGGTLPSSPPCAKKS